jgi:hypothetical protein
MVSISIVLVNPSISGRIKDVSDAMTTRKHFREQGGAVS